MLMKSLTMTSCVAFRCKQKENPEFPYWTYTQFDLDKLGTMNAVLNLDSGRMTYGLSDVLDYNRRE